MRIAMAMPSFLAGRCTGIVVGVFLIALSTPTPAAEVLHVGNRDTRLSVRAGAASPRLVQLSANGGMSWIGTMDAALIGQAMIDDRDIPLHWHFNRAASHMESSELRLVYDAGQPDLRLTWRWRARAAHGPLEHTIRIENRGDRGVWIPLQDSLRFAWKVPADRPLQQMWVDKGAGKAPSVGTHLQAIDVGYRWRGRSSSFAHPMAGQPREIIPFMMVRSTGRNPDGWYVGVEFSGRLAMTLQRREGRVEGRAGLDPDPGPFRTRLPPGGDFTTPTVFLGTSHGSIDDAGNALRRWVRAVLNDPKTTGSPVYPLLTNNSWGSGMAIDEKRARRMIDDSAALGFDMFHLDAGWFRDVGDWVPDPHTFPHGLAALADYAHQRKLKFGLWVDWAQAGNSDRRSAMSVIHPDTRDWLTTDPPPGWSPGQFKGITFDIGVPAARHWVEAELERLVRDNHLDMLEHDGYVIAQGCDRTDHPHATCDPGDVHRYADEGFLWQDGPNSTDVSYHAARAYEAVYRALKRRHPGLLLEICNDGGRMVDFATASLGDYFSIVDSYDPLSNRKAFYDASHLLPPAMLETYVMEVPTPRIENFRYMLRSGMMGWFTLMLDTTTWTREQHDAAREELRLYKRTLRPLIRSADLYHVAARPDGKGWDGLEYIDRARGRGVLYAFRGSAPDRPTHTYVLKGLDPHRGYRLHFHDGSAKDAVIDGRTLMQAGVSVHLPAPLSSELVMLEAQ